MKRFHIILISIIFIFLPVLTSAAAQSEEAFTDEMESEFLEWVNSARANPLEMVATVGLDPDQVLADLPELYDVLTRGLAPLRSNYRLTDSARSHTRDMLENDFYGYDSQDGRTPDDRIFEAGYVADMTDESLGILGFFNFIDPTDAVSQIFSAVYRDELNPERTRPRNILDPEFEDVGIGFGAGKLTLKGVSFNVYLVTCDFGKPIAPALEPELFELINQFRAKPLEMVEAYNIDLDPFLEIDNGLYEILTVPIAPLVPNGSLQSASKGHSVDMMTNNFIDHLSSDGRSTEDRLMENGYYPISTGEVLQRVEFAPFTETSCVLGQIMGQMLLDEITNYVDFGTSTLLNPDLQDLGIGMVSGAFELEDEAVDELITTATLGAEEEERPPYLVGTIYRDDDGNGLYSYGEGVSEIRVTVEWVHTISGFLEIKELWSNNAGGFHYPLDSGLHKVTIYVPEMEPVEYFFVPEEESIRLEHLLLPENLHNEELVENGP
jgi:uncharacterized protein YkwD